MFSYPLFIYKIWHSTKLQFTPLLIYFHVYSRKSDVQTTYWHSHRSTHCGEKNILGPNICVSESHKFNILGHLSLSTGHHCSGSICEWVSQSPAGKLAWLISNWSNRVVGWHLATSQMFWYGWRLTCGIFMLRYLTFTCENAPVRPREILALTEFVRI
jgi:hypothetical protein